MSHLDGLDEALGLVGKRSHGDFTFEEIRDKVKPIDAQREKDWAANIDMAELALVADADANVNTNTNIATEVDEVERKTIVKRRSSLMQIELEGLGLYSSSENDNSAEMKARRESFIMTGTIE